MPQLIPQDFPRHSGLQNLTAATKVYTDISAYPTDRRWPAVVELYNEVDWEQRDNLDDEPIDELNVEERFSIQLVVNTPAPTLSDVGFKVAVLESILTKNIMFGIKDTNAMVFDLVKSIRDDFSYLT